MLKANIAGASGYTGVELIRLLLNHPEVELGVLTSENYAGKKIHEIFPSLQGLCEETLVPLDDSLAESCDVLFLALPHTAVMSRAGHFAKSPARLIDLSADFRIHSAEIFEQWYHTPHLAPELLDQAVYGLPELHREAIRGSKFVANPGCYPTGAILGLAPLMSGDKADLGSIVVDSKSGVSGAGRKANLGTQFSECNESVSAYGLGTHRHTPEIEQELSGLAETEVKISFSPHLMPMTRGLLSTVYVDLKQTMTAEDLRDAYLEFYRDEPFVRILPPGRFANTSHVVTSNFCDIGVQVDTRTRRAVVTTAIDNLVKGASGQAVQNMNLMCGFKETTALMSPGAFP